MMGYSLGQRSLEVLSEVHPHLAEVVEMAISIVTVDFTVFEGKRFLTRQKELVASGKSHTLQSMHLPGKDGKARAVDLVPWVDRKLCWDWDSIFQIATAVRTAALECGRDIRWGGCWDMLLTSPQCASPQEAMAFYATRCAAQGKRVFLDGPHYELLRSQYPDSEDSTQLH